jgi:RND family efflux transporter MFP subunit
MRHSLQANSHPSSTSAQRPAAGGLLLLVCALLVSGLTAGPAHAQQLPVRGVVNPVQEATIATELFAPVSRVPLREGEAFKAGDLLIEFDCAGYLSQRKAAIAERKGLRLESENKKVLAKHNAVGRHELGIAEAKVDAAAARVEELDARISQCRITAPFDGRISALHVNEYEMPSAGNAIIDIINDNQFELELIVPSEWLNWLKSDNRFSFEVDETRTVLEAQIIRFGATVDPISQTVKLVGRFLAHPDGIKAGMSGSAHFKVPGG